MFFFFFAWLLLIIVNLRTYQKQHCDDSLRFKRKKCLKEFIKIQCYIECSLQLVYQFYVLNQHSIFNKTLSIQPYNCFLIILNLFTILFEAAFLFEEKLTNRLKSASIRVFLISISIIWNFVVLVPRLLLLTLFFIQLKKNFAYIFLLSYVNLMLFLIINFVEFKYYYQKDVKQKRDLIKIFRFTNIFNINVLYSLFGFNWFYTFHYSCFYEFFLKKKSLAITSLRIIFEFIFYFENAFLFYFFMLENVHKFYFNFILILNLISITFRIVLILLTCFKKQKLFF